MPCFQTESIQTQLARRVIQRIRLERVIPILVVSVLILTALSGSGAIAQAGARTPSVEPSQHERETGKYRVQDEETGYHYYVKTPSGFDPENDTAGIHVYIHGMRSSEYADDFSRFSRNFLNEHNLIGINMQYMDDNPNKDSENKARAALNAVRQVTADYKVVSRGAICAFSAGGSPLSEYYAMKGSQKHLSRDWPFNQISLYSTWLRSSIQPRRWWGWYMSLGEKEWDSYGSDLLLHHRSIIQQMNRGANPDSYFRVRANSDHEFTESDISNAAEIFHRTDIAFAHFLHLPSYPEKKAKRIALLANRHKFGPAKVKIQSILDRDDAAKTLVNQVKTISRKIDRRIDEMIQLCKTLADRDALLFMFYSKEIIKQLDGLPEQDTLMDLREKTTSDSSFQKRVQVSTAFRKEINKYIRNASIPKPRKNIPVLKKIQETVNPESQAGRMVSDFLNLSNGSR